MRFRGSLTCLLSVWQGTLRLHFQARPKNVENRRSASAIRSPSIYASVDMYCDPTDTTSEQISESRRADLRLGEVCPMWLSSARFLLDHFTDCFLYGSFYGIFNDRFQFSVSEGILACSGNRFLNSSFEGGS